MLRVPGDNPLFIIVSGKKNKRSAHQDQHTERFDVRDAYTSIIWEKKVEASTHVNIVLLFSHDVTKRLSIVYSLTRDEKWLCKHGLSVDRPFVTFSCNSRTRIIWFPGRSFCFVRVRSGLHTWLLVRRSSNVYKRDLSTGYKSVHPVTNVLAH